MKTNTEKKTKVTTEKEGKAKVKVPYVISISFGNWAFGFPAKEQKWITLHYRIRTGASKQSQKKQKKKEEDTTSKTQTPTQQQTQSSKKKKEEEEVEDPEAQAKKALATLPGGAKPRKLILEYLLERDRFKKQYPLITPADKLNDRKALHRKLTNRLYLIVRKNRNNHSWQFPQGGWEEKDGMHLRKVR
jgi:hypothetical protein